LFNVFDDIDERSQDLTRRITLNVRSAVADPISGISDRRERNFEKLNWRSPSCIRWKILIFNYYIVDKQQNSNYIKLNFCQ